MANTDGIRAELLRSVQDGRFLSCIRDIAITEHGNRSDLSEELVTLHNEGLVDVVSAFKELKKSADNQAHVVFLTATVFEKSLPKIDAPVLMVMECVLHLHYEAGQDLTAAYIDYCTAESSRPKEALKLIETSFSQFADLLAPTLMAGSRVDPSHYLKETIRFATHQDIEIRKRAILSMGWILYPEKSLLPEEALTALENSIKHETDDSVVANIIKSTFSLYKQDKSLEVRATNLIDTALAIGDDHCIHAASEIFWRDCNEISEPLLDILLLSLQRVKPTNKLTLDWIDYGLVNLLGRENPEKGIQFIEALLLANAGTLSLEVFDGVSRELYKNKGSLLNHLMTRWFLRGEIALCSAIEEIVRLGYQDKFLLEVDSNSLHGIDSAHILFLARKAIGYLFFYPVTATSVVVSLIPFATDEGVKKELANLLFASLLLNYPQKVANHLKEKAASENESIKNLCKEVLDTFDRYKDELKSTGDIRELHPPQSQREAYHRHSSKQMSATMKQAEAKSVFASIFAKSILLYGKKSINYMYVRADEPPNRMEIPLQNHLVEIDFPQSEIIDPIGLVYMWRTYRLEWIKL